MNDNFDSDNLLYVSKDYENEISDKAKQLYANDQVNQTQDSINRQLNSIISELNDKLDFVVNKISGPGGVDAYIEGVHTQIDSVSVNKESLVDSNIKNTTTHPSALAFKGSRAETNFKTYDFINQKITLDNSSDLVKLDGMGHLDDNAKLHTFQINVSDDEKMKIIEFSFMYKQTPELISFKNNEKVVTPSITVNRFFSGRFFVIKTNETNPNDIIVKAIIINSDNTGNVIDKRIFDVKEYKENGNVSYIFDNGPQFEMYFSINNNQLSISIGKIVPYRYVVTKNYIDTKSENNIENFTLSDISSNEINNITECYFSQNMKVSFIVDKIRNNIAVCTEGNKFDTRQLLNNASSLINYAEGSPIKEFWVKDVGPFTFIRINDGNQNTTYIGANSVYNLNNLNTIISDPYMLSSNEIVCNVGSSYVYLDSNTGELTNKSLLNIDYIEDFVSQTKLLEFDNKYVIVFYTTKNMIKYTVKSKNALTGTYKDSLENYVTVDLYSLDFETRLDNLNPTKSKVDAIKSASGIYVSATFINNANETVNFVVSLSNLIENDRNYIFKNQNILNEYNKITNILDTYTRGVKKLISTNLLDFIISSDNKLFIIDEERITKAIQFTDLGNGFWSDTDSPIYMEPESNQDQYYISDNAYLQNVYDIVDTPNGIIISDEKGIYKLNPDKNLDCVLFVGDNTRLITYLPTFDRDGLKGAALTENINAITKIYNIYTYDYSNKNLSNEHLRYKYIDLFKSDYQKYIDDDTEYSSDKPIINFKCDLYVTLIDHLSVIYNPESIYNIRYINNLPLSTIKSFNPEMFTLTTNKYGFKKYVNILSLDNNTSNQVSDINELKRIRIVHKKDDGVTFDELYETIMKLVRKQYIDIISDETIISRFAYTAHNRIDPAWKQYTKNIQQYRFNMGTTQVVASKHGLYYYYKNINDAGQSYIKFRPYSTLKYNDNIESRFSLNTGINLDLVEREFFVPEYFELLDLNDEYDHLIIATDAGTFCQNSRNMQPGEKHYEYRAPFTGKQIASQYVTRELRTNDNEYLQHIRRFDDGEIILWNETVNDIYTFNPNTFELNILPITIGSSYKILDIIKINNNYHIFGITDYDEKKIYYKIRGAKHEDLEISYLSVNSIPLGWPLTCKIYNYESAKFVYISYANDNDKNYNAYRGIYKWNETKNMFELSIEEFSKLSNRINVITGDTNIINDFDCAFTEIDGHIYGACALSYGSFPSLFEYLPKYNCVKELVNIPYNGLYVNENEIPPIYENRCITQYNHDLFYDEVFDVLHANNGCLSLQTKKKHFSKALSEITNTGRLPLVTVSNPILYDRTYNGKVYKDFNLYAIETDKTNGLLKYFMRNISKKSNKRTEIPKYLRETGVVTYKLTNDENTVEGKEYYTIDGSNTNLIPLNNVTKLINDIKKIRDLNNISRFMSFMHVYEVTFASDIQSNYVLVNTNKVRRPIEGFTYYTLNITGTFNNVTGITKFDPNLKYYTIKPILTEVDLTNTNLSVNPNAHYYYTYKPEMVTITSDYLITTVDNLGNNVTKLNKNISQIYEKVVIDDLRIYIGDHSYDSQFYKNSKIDRNRRISNPWNNPFINDPDTNKLILSVKQVFNCDNKIMYSTLLYLSYDWYDNDLFNSDNSKIIDHISEIPPCYQIKSTKLGLLKNDELNMLEINGDNIVTETTGLKLLSNDGKSVIKNYPNFKYDIYKPDIFCYETTNHVFLVDYINNITYTINPETYELVTAFNKAISDITEFEDGSIYGIDKSTERLLTFIKYNEETNQFDLSTVKSTNEQITDITTYVRTNKNGNTELYVFGKGLKYNIYKLSQNELSYVFKDDVVNFLPYVYTNDLPRFSREDWVLNNELYIPLRPCSTEPNLQLWYIVNPDDMSKNRYYNGNGRLYHIIDTSKIENYIGNYFDFMRNDFAIEYYKTSDFNYNIVLKQNVESVVEMSYPDNNIPEIIKTYPWLFTSKIFKSENSLPMVSKTGQLFYMNYKANDETLLPDLTKRIPIYNSDGLTIKTREFGKQYELKRSYMTSLGIFGFNGSDAFLYKVNENTNGYIQIGTLKPGFNTDERSQPSLYETTFGIFVVYNGNIYLFNTDTEKFELISECDLNYCNTNYLEYSFIENSKMFDAINKFDSKLFISEHKNRILQVTNYWELSNKASSGLICKCKIKEYNPITKTFDLKYYNDNWNVGNIRETPHGILITLTNNASNNNSNKNYTVAADYYVNIDKANEQVNTTATGIFDIVYSAKLNTLIVFGTNNISILNNKTNEWEIYSDYGTLFDEQPSSTKERPYHVELYKDILIDESNDTIGEVIIVCCNNEEYKIFKVTDNGFEPSARFTNKSEVYGIFVKKQNSKNILYCIYSGYNNYNINMRSKLFIGKIRLILNDSEISNGYKFAYANIRTLSQVEQIFCDVEFFKCDEYSFIPVISYNNINFFSIYGSLFIEGMDITRTEINTDVIPKNEKYIGFELKFIGKNEKIWNNTVKPKISTLSDKYAFKEVDLCKWDINKPSIIPETKNWYRSVVDINNHKTSYIKTDTMAKFYDTVYQFNEHSTKENTLFKDKRINKPSSLFDIINMEPTNMETFNSEDFEIELTIFPNLFVNPKQVSVMRPFDNIHDVSYRKTNPYLPYDPFTNVADISVTKPDLVDDIFFENCISYEFNNLSKRYLTSSPRDIYDSDDDITYEKTLNPDNLRSVRKFIEDIVNKTNQNESGE